MKTFFRGTILLVFSVIVMALTMCSDPFAPEEKETGEFTIRVNANNSRAVAYPPSTADIAALKFVFHFTPLSGSSGTAKDIPIEGKSTTKGKVDAGHYTVTMDVYALSDNSLYARGVADNNPVEIKAGSAITINIDAFNAASAAPPVINAQPEGATYYEGETAAALTVAADLPSDGGTLKYQWYSNATNSNSGGNAIPGETSASYIPPTAANSYYYAMVINEKGGSQTSMPSKAAMVTVTGLGSGTMQDPFKVHDATTLQRVGKGTNASWNGNWSMGAYYSQVRNIDLSSIPNWTPIGPYDFDSDTGTPFMGSYDGGGHTISNLKITSATATGVGLFCYIGSGAVVKNVGINCNITANNIVGGVAGANLGTVQYCYTTGTVSGNYGVGGVAGVTTDGTVQYCYSTCTVSATGTDGGVGGVVGWNSDDGTVQNCYATGNVSGPDEVGGVAGYNGDSTTTLKNCYATGTVRATGTYSEAGGVAGMGNNSKVENCVGLNPNVIGTNHGNRVLGNNISTGGGSIISGYGRSDMNGSSTWGTPSATSLNGANITSDDWKLASWWEARGFTAANWDFTGIEDGIHLPKLKNMPGGLEAQNPVIQ